MYNALANFMKNATDGALEKTVNKNPDLRLELYSLQLHWKLTLTQAFYQDKKNFLVLHIC